MNTITIPAGEYTREQLQAAIEQALGEGVKVTIAVEYPEGFEGGGGSGGGGGASGEW